MLFQLHRRTYASFALASVLLGLTARTSIAHAAPAREERFAPQVRAYEAADRASPAPRHAILLVGDSQFFRWRTLAEDLPGYTIVNRGIDGFELSDLNHFFDRVVAPYQPRLIVLNVGGNDIHNGKSAARVVDDLRIFVELARKQNPGVPIFFSSTTPGPARWSEASRRRELNAQVRDYVTHEPAMAYIDLWDAMLTPDGRPRDDIWVADRIHPNHEGYLIRARLTRPLLGPPDRAAAR